MRKLDLPEQAKRPVESVDQFLRRHGWVIFSRKRGQSPEWCKGNKKTSQEAALRMAEAEEKAGHKLFE